MCYMVYKQLLRLKVILKRDEEACWVARLSISKCGASIVCMGQNITLTKSEKVLETYTLTK